MPKGGFTIEFDTSELERNLNKLSDESDKWWREARSQMAEALLNLSQKEVPHDLGSLQASGKVFYKDNEDSWVVEYGSGNAKKYAIYVHEGMREDGSHVIANYQKGRKKKYLFDPLTKNLSLWNKTGLEFVKKKLNGKL